MLLEAVAFIKRAQFLDTMQLVWPRTKKKNIASSINVRQIKKKALELYELKFFFL